MPTYLYECPNCGEFEIEHSIKDEALTRCPNKVPAESVYGSDFSGMEATCDEPIRRLINVDPRNIGGMPIHLSDANIAATSKQREWLKTPEAKAMDLVPCKDA